MISRGLDLMEANFINHLTKLPSEDRVKGIPSRVIATWINRNNQTVNILMPLLGWKIFVLDEEVYWFEECSYNDFVSKISTHLIAPEIVVNDLYRQH